MLVCVRTLAGGVIELEVAPGETVEELKARAIAKAGPPVAGVRYKLYQHGSALDDRMLAESLRVHPGQFLLLVSFASKKTSRKLTWQQTESRQAAQDGGCEDNQEQTSSLVSDAACAAKTAQGQGQSTILGPRVWQHVCHGKPDDPETATSHQRVFNPDDVLHAIAADLASAPRIPNMEDVVADAFREHMGDKDANNLSEEEERELGEEEEGNQGKAEQLGPSPRVRKPEPWEALPLPPATDRLQEVFAGLNAVYMFLQRQHLQATWQTLRSAWEELVRRPVQLEELEELATVCPPVIKLRHVTSAAGTEHVFIDLVDPSSKARHYIAPPKAVNVLPDPTHFNTSGNAGVNKGGLIWDVVPPANRRMSDKQAASIVDRRRRLFRKWLAITVSHLHAQFLQAKGYESFDPIKAGKWHADYLVDSIRLPDLLAAVSAVEESRLVPPAREVPADPKRKQQQDRQRQPLRTRCKGTGEMEVEGMLGHLKEVLGENGQMVHTQFIPKRLPRYQLTPEGLSQEAQRALRQKAIKQLFTHQAEAIRAALAGEHVVVATSTASGKSLCYNVPVLSALTSDPNSCAMYMFPTKALAQDQLRALMEFMKNGNMREEGIACVYDGDTWQGDRAGIRDTARLIITNPDMLHVSVLPCHRQFRRILANLRYVVVDEAHAYSGVFGCHCAMVFRRLRRICEQVYCNTPQFVVASATIANPRDHVQALLGIKEMRVITQDGSPCGDKYFVLWNPALRSMPKSKVNSTTKKPKKPPKREGLTVQELRKLERIAQAKQLAERRASPIVDLALLLAEMVQHGLRCIAFCHTRKLCELVLTYAREQLKETDPALANMVRSYRAGYTAADRRDIEAALFSGRLLGVAATNALELGVDVGCLDATLHLGFPGSIASLWQQAGRAGRREKPSLSIYVGFDGPTDQYFMRKPSELFTRAIEGAQVDTHNPAVIQQHVMCAAAEQPLLPASDAVYFGSSLSAAVDELLKQGTLGRHATHMADVAVHYIGREESPSRSVSIRMIEAIRYRVVDEATGSVIEEVEENKAFFEIYEGAVYLHQGKTFLCTKLDIQNKVGTVRRADVNYYTKTRDYTDVQVMGGQLSYPMRRSSKQYPSTTAQCMPARVVLRFLGFQRIWRGTGESFDSIDLFLPAVEFSTHASWIRIPHKVRAALEPLGIPYAESVHGANHAILNVLSMYVACSTKDVGTECASPHDTRYRPERLLVYDNHSGGIGLAAQVQPMFAELLQAAYELVLQCECEAYAGCPDCVQYFGCSEYNQVLNKEGAIVILKAVIDSETAHRNGADGSAPSEQAPSLPAPDAGLSNLG